MLLDLCKDRIAKKVIDNWEKKNSNEELCYKCKKCNGTGLKDFKFGGHWSGEFCDKCNGDGLFYFFELIKQGFDLNDFYTDNDNDND